MLNKEISILLEDAILEDAKFIGDVYRLRKDGKTVKEIAEIFGHKNSGNVITFDYAIEALFSRVPVDELKYHSNKQFVITAKRILGKSSNNALNYYLENLLKSDNDEPTVELIKIEKESEPMKILHPPALQQSYYPEPAVMKPGVYIYSYPQYLSMEAISPDGKALYKIGASSNTDKRIERQRRQTEVPEDLVLVRVFHCENAFETEKKFHNILSAANFHHKSTSGGTEWFNCNLATLDAIATALYLHNESAHV